MKKTMKKLLVLAWGLLAAGPVFPKVKLPSVLGSNMALQRECDANLWGWASPSKKVTVTTSSDSQQICRLGPTPTATGC